MKKEGEGTNNKDNPTKKMTIKIMMIGEQAVGKSSITKRYTEQIFVTNIMGTAGLDMKQKVVNIFDENVNVIIYDSAGHERFRKITEVQYKGSDGLVLIYDITDSKSFDWIIEWIDKLKIDNIPNMEIILLGNKIDLDGRQINKNQAQEIADKYNITLLETSALTGENVDEAFDHIIKNIYKCKMSLMKKDENENKTENGNATDHNMIQNNKRFDKKKKDNFCCSIL